ncbi:MAG: hypothetical protein HGA24_07800 [Candidatus Aminicenantes bacterium]|nr:hypothetical protein [Candidatus Aminicenantes bacterium]
MAMISAENRGLKLATRYAVLILIAIIFLFPLVFMLMSSLKPTQQLLEDSGNIRAFLPVGEISLQKGNPEAVCGPGGLDLVTVEQPVPQANLGALIGRVAQLVASRIDEDSGLEIRDEVFVLFLVGPESAASAPFKGRLYLGVNENVVKDNGGEFSVLVTRRPI